MTPYLLLLAGVTSLSFLGGKVRSELHNRRMSRPWVSESRRRPAWTLFDIVSAAALILFSGLRFGVGTDYHNYARLYRVVDTADWTATIAASPQEVGFTTLMLTVKSINDSPYAMFWVAAVVTVIPVYIVIQRHSAIPALSVFMYVAMVYSTSFNAVRQGMAASLILLAWIYLGKKNWGFVLLAAVAASIHMTALFVAIALVVARRWRFRTWTVVLILVAAAVSSVFVDQVPQVGGWLSSFNPRYADYLESGDTGMGAYLQVAGYMLLLLFCLTGRDRLPGKEMQLAVYVAIGIAFMIVGTQAVVVFRMGAYFTPFLILLLPSRVAVMNKESDAATMIAALVGAITLYFIMHLAFYGDMVPYVTYLTL